MQTHADSHFIRAFAGYQERRNFSPRTVGCREAVLVAFAGWLDPRSLLEAEPADVERWLDTRRLGAQGRYTYLAHLHAFYRFAARRGFDVADPTEAIERPKLPRRLPRPITPAELDAALTAAGPRMRAWLYLGAYAGFRRAEIANLQAEDVLQADSALRVCGKGDKEAILPLHPAILDALVGCGLPRCGPVFAGPDGRAVSPAHVGVARFLRSVGINRTAHSLRHHFGTEVYRACRDLLLTKALMRHSTMASTEGYIALDVEPGRKVVARIGQSTLGVSGEIHA